MKVYMSIGCPKFNFGPLERRQPHISDLKKLEMPAEKVVATLAPSD